MSEIASAKAPAPSHAQAHAWRSAHHADPASSSPFASLLDATDADTPPSAPQQQPQQAPAEPAAPAAKPDDKAAANDNATAANPAPEGAGAGQTVFSPGVAAVVATASAAAKTVSADPAAGADTTAQPDGSTTKTGKKDAQAADAAAEGLSLAAAQASSSNPPPAAVIVVQTAQQTEPSPAATVATAAVGKGGQPAVLPQPSNAIGTSGLLKGAPAKTDGGKDDARTGDTAPPAATVAKSDAVPAGPGAVKALSASDKGDTSNGNGAAVVTTDGAQQGIPQPDPNAQPAAPADAQAPALASAAVDKIAAAVRPAEAPRHDVDPAAALMAGPNAPGMTGGDTSAAAQAATASAAATGSATASAGGGTAPSGTPAAPAASVPVAVPLSGLAVEIAGKALANKNRFEIRLDPPELGRIEVKLSVDRQGQLTSHVIADRSDTLDLLRRDASGLERSLQDAGLKMSGNGLQFSLRDQSSSGQQNTASRASASQIVVQDSVSVDAPRGYTAYSSRVGGLDIRV